MSQNQERVDAILHQLGRYIERASPEKPTQAAVAVAGQMIRSITGLGDRNVTFNCWPDGSLYLQIDDDNDNKLSFGGVLGFVIDPEGKVTIEHADEKTNLRVEVETHFHG